MDFLGFELLAGAVSTVLRPDVLAVVLLGVLAGLLFGAAPGLTATAGVAIATPLTFGASFELAMALLLGLYCAGYFAGSIPAILINTPGAPGNAATALSGYRLAQAGRADVALSLAIVCSVIGGVFSLLVLMAAAPWLAGFALEFTAVEYCVLGLFGLMCVAAVSGGALTKGIVAAAFGMTLGTVGIDEVGGIPRFMLGMPELQAGVALIPALIGFFAVGEMLSQAAKRSGGDAAAVPRQAKFPLIQLPGLLGRNLGLLLRSAGLGTAIGVLPGTGPTIASWIAYGGIGEKGDRDVRGVIASESANNAVTGGALVPLLTLGIPGDTVTAVLIGALLIQGIEPGPFFIVEHSHLFAQILMILLVSAAMILVLGLVARRALWLVLLCPPRILLPVVGVLSATGTFAIGHAPFEVGLAAVLGLIGFCLGRFGFPAAPIVIGLVLGPIVEVNLRNALVANDMDFSVFLTRPISATLIAALLALLAWRGWRAFGDRIARRGP